MLELTQETQSLCSLHPPTSTNVARYDVMFLPLSRLTSIPIHISLLIEAGNILQLFGVYNAFSWVTLCTQSPETCWVLSVVRDLEATRGGDGLEENHLSPARTPPQERPVEVLEAPGLPLALHSELELGIQSPELIFSPLFSCALRSSQAAHSPCTPFPGTFYASSCWVTQSLLGPCLQRSKCDHLRD